MSTATSSTLTAVCKLRHLPKKPTDQMVIQNIEAMRLMTSAIFLEQRDEWEKAAAAENKAKQILEKELEEYLAGVKHTVPISSDDTWSMSSLGGML